MEGDSGDFKNCLIKITNLGDLFTKEQLNSAKERLRQLGWDVVFTSQLRDEAGGIYYRLSDGNWQILGYSIPIPPELTLALNHVLESLL